MKKICCVLLLLCMLFGLRVSALSTSAKSSILINGDTGEVIFEENSELKLPMASTTKIMTALLLCESGGLDREITVTAEQLRVEGSSMGLLAGDKITLKGLLYGMLLASGNDAANVTAYTLGGTVDGFVKMMNDRAKELGLFNTSFATPSGLDGDNHYTTAKDLAKLARFAMQNEDFSTAASSSSAVLKFGNPPYKRTITNHNKLLKIFDGAIGVKTGFTKKAGRCLVSAARRDGKFVIAVTLCDPDDWDDHTKLLNYGLDSIKSTEISPEKTEYTVSVISSKEEKIKVSVSPFKINAVETDGFSCRVDLPSFLYAPLSKGDVVGSVVYLKNGTEFARRDIVANESIKASPSKRGFAEKIKENLIIIFKCIWEN